MRDRSENSHASLRPPSDRRRESYTPRVHRTVREPLDLHRSHQVNVVVPNACQCTNRSLLSRASRIGQSRRRENGWRKSSAAISPTTPCQPMVWRCPHFDITSPSFGIGSCDEEVPEGSGVARKRIPAQPAKFSGAKKAHLPAAATRAVANWRSCPDQGRRQLAIMDRESTRLGAPLSVHSRRAWTSKWTPAMRKYRSFIFGSANASYPILCCRPRLAPVREESAKTDRSCDRYESAMAALREDTQTWWSETLVGHPEEFSAELAQVLAPPSASYDEIRAAGWPFPLIRSLLTE